MRSETSVHRELFGFLFPGMILHARQSKNIRKSVRADAPWCPDNIEFIKRINGLDNIEEVRQIAYEASYLVLGLGDVYLQAPCGHSSRSPAPISYYQV